MEKLEAIQFIKGSLIYLQKKFVCSFKCEFNPITYTFLIEDVILDTEENKILYEKETQKIIEDFERFFPCVMLAFIGDEYKLKNPIFEL